MTTSAGFTTRVARDARDGGWCHAARGVGIDKGRADSASISAIRVENELVQPIQTSVWQDSRRFKLGAGVGVFVLTYAGAWWAFGALGSHPGTPAWQFVAAMIPVLTLTTFLVVRLVAVVRSPSRKPSVAEAAEGARRGRRMGILFGLVCTAEGLLIASAASMLSSAGRPLLIPVAVAAIVGLHFIPLSRIFSMPIYMVTGTLIAGLAAASLLIADEHVRVFALSLLVAGVLWASAARALVYTRTLPRTSQ